MKCTDQSLLVDLALDNELDMARPAEFERHLQSVPTALSPMLRHPCCPEWGRSPERSSFIG